MKGSFRNTVASKRRRKRDLLDEWVSMARFSQQHTGKVEAHHDCLRVMLGPDLTGCRPAQASTPPPRRQLLCGTRRSAFWRCCPRSMGTRPSVRIRWAKRRPRKRSFLVGARWQETCKSAQRSSIPGREFQKEQSRDEAFAGGAVEAEALRQEDVRRFANKPAFDN